MAGQELRSVGVITVLLISLSLRGDRPAQVDAVADAARHPDLQRMLLRANKYYSASQFESALREYLAGLTHTPPSLPRYSAQFLIGMGNCQGMLWQNTDSIQSFNEAIRLTRSHQFSDLEMKAQVGRITIYKRMPDLFAAQQAVRELQVLANDTRDPSMLVHIAGMTRDIDFNTAVSLYHKAVVEGSMKLDNYSLSMVWGQLGNSWLLRGDAAHAEPALTEAFRLRYVAGRRELQGYYFYLGWLRRLQGRFAEAVTLLKEARRRSGEPGSLSAWFVDRELARTEAQAGNLRSALAWYESAARLAEESRAFTLPAESFRVAAEEGLHSLFTEYVDIGMRLHERENDPALPARLLEAADESRRILFRTALATQSQLPPEYLSRVAEYRRALGESLHDDEEDSRERLDQLRLELANLEIELGIDRENSSPQILERKGSANSLKGIQRKLRDSELLLSFLVARSGSFVWAVTRDSLEVHRLAGSTVLSEHVTRYRQSLESNSPDAGQHGRTVSNDLFSAVSEKARSRRDWIVSLDAPLFDLPLSSLPEPAGDAPLAERHSLRITPSLSGRTAVPEHTSRTFTGLADPVYNRADSRVTEGGGTSAAAEMELPRLPGSARELRRCASAWGFDESPRLVTGSNAGRDSLQEELAKGPAVLHLGMHVVRHAAIKEEVMIALGRKSGEPDYLTALEVAKWRYPLGVVTLSGCSSGAGHARPGLGLFGLTRAWLTAGASTVVASYWPIRDDDGQLMASMYAELHRRGGRTRSLDVARALQEAQKRSKNRSDWQSRPAYWAAFFVVSKE
jgi:CHAT domain-containing protein